MGEAKKRIEAKKKAFEADPDKFIHLDDVILAAVKKFGPNGEHGIGYFLNHGIGDIALKSLVFDFQEMVSDHLVRKKGVQQAEEAKKDPGIIVPGQNNNGK